MGEALDAQPGGEKRGKARGNAGAIHMIVARSVNGVIGKGGRLPWRLRDDMRFFKEMTTGNTVVMGRKTFESLGKPLSDRKNIVITRDRHFAAGGVTVVHSPAEALRVPRQGDLFVIGGQQIYEAFLPRTDVIYVTVVEASVDGDARFPELGLEWEFTELSRHDADVHNDYAYVIYRAERTPDIR